MTYITEVKIFCNSPKRNQ